MTSREFCYWLQWYFEIEGMTEPMNTSQVECVKRHLALVFTHEIDPSYPEKEKLDAIHDPATPGASPFLTPLSSLGSDGKTYRC